jgi:hypothetical protein
VNPHGAIDQFAEPPIADCHRQVERILQSVSFRNATTLQQLLQFLTARLLDGSSEPLKEYTIGVEAFGRSADFDPKTDTIVRVQIHRLRQKLGEYYEGEGRLDPILISIPKGHYLPTFELVAGIIGVNEHHPLIDRNSRGSANEDALSFSSDEAKEGTAPAATLWMRGGSTWVGIAVVAAVAAAFTIGMFVGLHRTEQVNTQASDVSIQSLATGSDPVKAFWASFVGDDPNPVIAYPDAVFLLDNSNDLFRYRRGASDDRGSLVDPHLARQFASNPDLVARAGALYYENGYTGVGELQAVAMLAGLFGQMGLKPIIKPSRDITPVDLRQHSVILLGSSFQNVAVAQLMSPGDFRFRNPDQRLEQWRAEIVNTQPRQGEAAAYHTVRDEQTRVLKQDYAIISVQAGVVSGRHIAVLGGLDTTGTEGVTMFATTHSGVDELIRQMGIHQQTGQPMNMPQFQALVRVRLEKGYEVLGSTLVALHPIGAAGHGPESETSSPAQ